MLPTSTCPLRRLPNGFPIPSLGLGTWRMGEHSDRAALEVRAVREALNMGYRLIDTAEMYGEGGAETVVGTALRQAIEAGDVRRDDITVVSKVYPHNASRSGVRQACSRSLRRLGLDYIDIYLLHWRGEVPLADTLAGFQELIHAGQIRHWGVSNFDTDDMAELWALPGGSGCVTNQVYYSLEARGIEFDLLPWQRGHKLPLMAYSPIAQGVLAGRAEVAAIAADAGCTAAQLALAWVLRQPEVIAIPKAIGTDHLRDNWAAAHITLPADVLARLDAIFVPTGRKEPLAMI